MLKTTFNPGAPGPRQYALIGVLGIILVCVVMTQLSSDDSPAPLEVVRPPMAASGAMPASTSAPTPARTVPAKRPLPEIPLAEVISFNPFARSPAAVKVSAKQTVESEEHNRKMQERLREKQEQERLLAELRSKRVQFVFSNGSETVATVGDKTVRVGDVLNGFRVVAIDKDGVVLSSGRDGK